MESNARISVIVTMAASFCFSITHAGVTVLTFDDLGLPDNTIITDQYADQGVIFSPQDGNLEIRTASKPIFPDEPQGLAEIPYSESVIIADFLSITNAAGAWIDFGDVGNGVILEAFDGPGATGNLLVSNTTTSEEFLGVEAAGIRSVRFMKAAGGTVTFLIDNFEFQSEAACFGLIDDEITCHADGSTFTYTVEGTDACTGGTSTYSFTASGGAAGEALCFSLLVTGEGGGFCCSTEICVTIPDCSSEVLVCDFQTLLPGDVVTDQCPGATFSSTPGNENVVQSGYSNFICTRPIGQSQTTCLEDTYIDFTNPVDSLMFKAIELNSVGVVAAQVNVFVNGSFDATVDIIGTGDAFPIIDLGTFSSVTRIEIVNIISNNRNGIGWDNFSYKVMADVPCDLNGDGIVDIVDFLALLAAWGSCSDCGTCPADFDGDCSVGILDMLILLGNWG